MSIFCLILGFLLFWIISCYICTCTSGIVSNFDMHVWNEMSRFLFFVSDFGILKMGRLWIVIRPFFLRSVWFKGYYNRFASCKVKSEDSYNKSFSRVPSRYIKLDLVISFNGPKIKLSLQRHFGTLFWF